MGRGPYHAIKHSTSPDVNNYEFFPIVSKPAFQNSNNWNFKLTASEDWLPSSLFHEHVLKVYNELKIRLSTCTLNSFKDIAHRINHLTDGNVSKTDVMSVCLQRLMSDIHGSKFMPTDIYQNEMAMPCHLKSNESLLSLIHI